MLWNLLKSIQALGDLPPSHDESEFMLQCANGSTISCLNFKPKGHPRGTIVMIHGMNPAGARDLRWIQLSRLFCSCGFTVYAPHFNSIAELKIEVQQVDIVEQTLLALAQKVSATSTENIKVVSVSFSVGVTLIAASRVSLKYRLSGILAIGGVVDFDLAVDAAMTDASIDPIVFTLLFANHIGTVDPTLIPLRKTFTDIALVEFATGVLDWKANLEELSDNKQRELTLLMSDRNYRQNRWLQIRSHLHDHFIELNPKMIIRSLHAPVWFLHGENDAVLSPKHSQVGYHILGPERSSLCITPLLTHGDSVKSTWKLIKNGPAIVTTFWNFLKTKQITDSSTKAKAG
jgi:pimeloyl-ACP methyl ester carboxylesterase